MISEMDVSVAEKEVDAKGVWRILVELRAMKGRVYQVFSKLGLTLFSRMLVQTKLFALPLGQKNILDS